MSLFSWLLAGAFHSIGSIALLSPPFPLVSEASAVPAAPSPAPAWPASRLPPTWGSPVSHAVCSLSDPLAVRRHIATTPARVRHRAAKKAAPVNPCLTDDPLAPLPEKEAERALWANRDEARLDAEFRTRFDAVIAGMKEAGYEVMLLEGYRTPQRQQSLLDSEEDVTQAGACRSWHQYGLAADVAFIKDGAIVQSARSAWAREGYRVYGELAKDQGLVWGGRWADFGHIEFHKPGVHLRPLPAEEPQGLLAKGSPCPLGPWEAPQAIAIAWGLTPSPVSCAPTKAFDPTKAILVVRADAREKRA